MRARTFSRVSVGGSAVALAAASILSVACSGRPAGGGTGDQPQATLAWEYPVHLGDDRTKVKAVLGQPILRPGYETYPASGVEVWYGSGDTVAKLVFLGQGAALYGADEAQLPSKHPLMLGLTSQADEAAFRRALGPPTQEGPGRVPDKRVRRCVWRTKSLLIDAEFLTEARTEPGRTFAAGVLIWFSVSRVS